MAMEKRKIEETPIPTREDVLTYIERSRVDLEKKAFACLLWISAARIGELLKNKIRGWEGILLNSFEEKDAGGVNCIYIMRVPIEKKFERKYSLNKYGDPIRKFGRKVILSKKSRFEARNIPIRETSNNEPFIKYIREWYLYRLKQEERSREEVTREKDIDIRELDSLKNTPLFPNRDRRWGYKAIRKINSNWWAHLFRHSRLTHLAKVYNLTPAKLRALTGWADDKPASVYTNLSSEDVAPEIDG